MLALLYRINVFLRACDELTVYTPSCRAGAAAVTVALEGCSRLSSISVSLYSSATSACSNGSAGADDESAGELTGLGWCSLQLSEMLPPCWHVPDVKVLHSIQVCFCWSERYWGGGEIGWVGGRKRERGGQRGTRRVGVINANQVCDTSSVHGLVPLAKAGLGHRQSQVVLCHPGNQYPGVGSAIRR